MPGFDSFALRQAIAELRHRTERFLPFARFWPCSFCRGRLDAVQLSDISFSESKKKRVIDADGVRIGSFIDVRFDGEGGTWFVLGGGFVQQTLEKLHIRPNIDLLVPAEWIESVGSDEIVLKRSVFQLESTCEECWEREKDRLLAEATATHRDGNSVLHLTDPWGRVI